MTAIAVESVSKVYRQYADEAMLLKRLLSPHRSRTVNHIVALDDISFTVDRGESVGIIGRNGSGKTTLLRLLSGVTGPTGGRIIVNGSVAPLIGIGVGFNNELSGRENVRVNGRLLGLSDEQIDDRFEDIVAFSEIGEFIDVPVKFYSSGMFLRLAFAVAVHTEPQILVVDEIMAVGDVGFQAKSDARMREIRESGATLVVVTHNMQVLQRSARRALVLDNGRLVHDGATAQAISIYHDIIQEHGESRIATTDSGAVRADVTAEVIDHRGQVTGSVRAGDPIQVRVRAAFNADAQGVAVAVAVERPGLGILTAVASDPHAYDGVHGPERPLDALVEFSNTNLLPGTLSIHALISVSGQVAAAGRARPLFVSVESKAPGGGPVDLAPGFVLAGVEVPSFEKPGLDLGDGWEPRPDMPDSSSGLGGT